MYMSTKNVNNSEICSLSENASFHKLADKAMHFSKLKNVAGSKKEVLHIASEIKCRNSFTHSHIFSLQFKATLLHYYLILLLLTICQYICGSVLIRNLDMLISKFTSKA